MANMAAYPRLLAYKVVFIALGCIMLATLIYTIVTDGSPFRSELLTPWMVATLIDFYVNVVALAVWVAYRETTWITAVLWVVLLVCFGSVATCAYITRKLFNISAEDLQDPVSQLLLRKDHECGVKGFCIVVGRVLFSTLGIFVLVVVVYTVITDGLPFRMELLTPWMAATLIDFYINVLAISVWVVHKESTWLVLRRVLILSCNFSGSLSNIRCTIFWPTLKPSMEEVYPRNIGAIEVHALHALIHFALCSKCVQKLLVRQVHNLFCNM